MAGALSQSATQFVQSISSDLLKQAILGGKMGIDWEKAAYQALLGALTGGITTGVQEAGKGIGNALDAAEGKIGAREAEEYAKNPKQSDNGSDTEGAGDAPIKPYTTSRPKYGSTQVDDVWNSHVDSETGTVTDPSGARIVWDRTKPRNGQWDMGHIPGHKYSDIHSKYMNGEISLDEFLKWYRNPQNYRPELPGTNRSHLYENGETYLK